MSLLKCMLCLLFLLTACKENQTEVVEIDCFSNPDIEKIELSSERKYNDGLDYIWKQIFKEDYVRSPFLPVEYVREFAESSYRTSELKEIAHCEGQYLEEIWQNTKRKSGPRADILRYIFQEVTFEEINKKIKGFNFDLQFEFCRVLLGECRYEEGFNFLRFLKETVTEPHLIAKIDLLLKHSAIMENLLLNDAPESANHNLKDFLPDGTTGYEPMEVFEHHVIYFEEGGSSFPEHHCYSYENGEFIWPPLNLQVQHSLQNHSINEKKERSYWIPGKQHKMTFKSEYKGKVNFKLYRIDDSETFEKLKAADIQKLEPVTEWVQNAGEIQDNNNGLVKETEIQLPDKPDKGLYVLTAGMKFCPALTLKRFIVADHLFYARHLPGTLSVLALDAKTLMPAADLDINVEHATDGNGKNSQIKTDDTGWAEFKYSDLNKNFFAVTSVKNPLLGKTYLYSNQIEDQTLFSVWSSRPLYRAGEKVSFRGNIRAIKSGISSLPRYKEVKVKILKPDGKELESKTCTLTANGSFFGDFQLKKDAPKGNYRYVIDGWRRFPAFKVGEFRLPRFQLTFSKKEIFSVKRKFNTSVSLNHLNGTPMVDSEVTFELKQYASDELIKSWKEKTGFSGTAYCFITERELKQNKTYRLTASYRSADGERIESSQNIILNESPYFVSIRTQNHLIGKYLVNAFFTDYKGKEIKPDKIEWAVVCNGGVTYTVRNNSPQLDVDRLHNPEAVYCKITKGKYTAQRKVSLTRKSRQQNYANGITVEAKEMSVPGETVNLDIYMNLEEEKENYTVYLFGQNSKLWFRKVLQLKPGMNKIPVKMKSEWGPNIYFSAVYIQDHENTLSADCKVKVRRKANEMDLRSLASKKVYKPGELCQIKFSCRDSSFTPVQGAEISISVIDESLYFVKDDETPSLSKTFNLYSLKNHYADAFRTKHEYYPQLNWFLGPALVNYFSTGVHTYAGMARGMSSYGGSSAGRAMKIGNLPRVRKGFTLEAFWKPVITTDAKGYAEVSFKLPDTITSWRITARAMSPQGKTGDHKAWFSTSVPVETDVILPRVVRTGDKIAVPVTVLNRTYDTNAKIYAAATVSGSKLNNLNDRFAIRKNSLNSSFMNIKVPESGTINFRSVVHAGQHSDTVERKLKITPLGYHNYDVLNAAVKKTFSLSLRERDMVPGSMNLTLRLENSLDEKIDSALDRLIKYRYGCAEQTISRFTPLIVVADSYNKAGLKNPHEEKMPALIEEGLARLYRFQHADGGWKWYETGASDYRVSVLVLEGLLEALDQGVEVNADVVRKGAEYVRKRFGSGSDSAASEQMGAGDKTDYLAAVVLSRYCSIFKESKMIGTVKAKVNSLQKRIRYQIEALHLCEVMANLKMNTEAVQLLNKFIAKNYDTSKREGIMTLSKKLYVAKKILKDVDLSAEALELLKAKKDGWWIDTRATNCAVRAIAGYITGNEGDTSLEVYLNNKKIGTLKSNSKPVILNSAAGRITLVNKGKKIVQASIAKEWHAASRNQPRNPQVKLKAEFLNKKTKINSGKRILLKSKDYYTYRLTLDSKVGLNYCHISIPRPAGMELNGKPALPPGVVSFEEYNDSFNFFIEKMPAGNRTFELSFRSDLKGEVFAPLPELGKMYGDRLTVSSEAPEKWIVE